MKNILSNWGFERFLKSFWCDQESYKHDIFITIDLQLFELWMLLLKLFNPSEVPLANHFYVCFKSEGQKNQGTRSKRWPYSSVSEEIWEKSTNIQRAFLLPYNADAKQKVSAKWSKSKSWRIAWKRYVLGVAFPRLMGLLLFEG